MFRGPVPEVSFFFSQPAAGLTNRAPVRDSRAGTPLTVFLFDRICKGMLSMISIQSKKMFRTFLCTSESCNTVPFKSIRQSRITRPSKTLKCHGGHSNFCKVLNSFSDHVPNIEIFRHLWRKTAEKFPKIWTCHGKFGRLPKPKFRQTCHRSHPLPNWFEWYSSLRVYCRHRCHSSLSPGADVAVAAANSDTGADVALAVVHCTDGVGIGIVLAPAIAPVAAPADSC